MYSNQSKVQAQCAPCFHYIAVILSLKTFIQLQFSFLREEFPIHKSSENKHFQNNDDDHNQFVCHNSEEKKWNKTIDC